MEEQLSNIYETLRKQRVERFKDLDDNNPRKKSTIEGSTLKKYGSVIKTIYNSIFKDDTLKPELFIKQQPKVMNYLETKYKDVNEPFTTRRHIYNALYVYTNHEDYRELMKKDSELYKKKQDKRERTPKQKENWIEVNKIKELLNELKVEANVLFKKLKKLNAKPPTQTELQTIQKYLILLLCSGLYFPIRRSKDWIDFKLKTTDIDPQKDNYMDEDEFVFNSYKTAKTYGQQKIKLTTVKQGGDVKSKEALKEILKALDNWKQINPNTYLFFDKSNKPLTQSALTNRLNKIFGNTKGYGGVSINLLRNIMNTSMDGGALKKVNKIKTHLEKSGSSASQLNTYVKDL